MTAYQWWTAAIGAGVLFVIGGFLIVGAKARAKVEKNCREAEDQDNW